jgi:hypothetical protein
MNNDTSDMTPFINLYTKMNDDSLDNGINMFNENNENVNTQNMFSYFYQFIKKYIVITKDTSKIIDV